VANIYLCVQVFQLFVHVAFLFQMVNLCLFFRPYKNLIRSVLQENTGCRIRTTMKKGQPLRNFSFFEKLDNPEFFSENPEKPDFCSSIINPFFNITARVVLIYGACNVPV